jgi:hypothetical protein
MRFRRCACHGWKMLVNNAYEDKTLSINQTNCVIKAVQDERVTKMMKMTPNAIVAVAAV